jgi:hypothetical protein
MGYTLLLVLVRMVDVINLCRNISDGVRPFIPPFSLVSLYALTNILSDLYPVPAGQL